MSSFEQRYGPWYQRQSENVDDRRNEPWPWHQVVKQYPQYTPTDEEVARDVLDRMEANAPKPPTPLSLAAGIRDVQQPTPEELIRFLINVDATNGR